MKNLIVTAFAFKEGFQTSLQTGRTAGDATTDMYMKNIFVALRSAKEYNSKDEVAVAVNEKLPEKYEKMFTAEGISILHIPFDTFVMPKKFAWALAFYKACVMKHLAEEGKYEHILLLDGDTYTTASYENLWKEAEHGILLYNVGHEYTHKDREIIRKDYRRLYPEETADVIHYGGEFIAGTSKNLKSYMEVVYGVYRKIEEQHFEIEEKAGDETLWSIAAALEKKIPIIAANAYLYRFWTGRFYLVSTQTVYNPVCIWHIPNEKETGFLRMFAYYQKKGSFPTVKRSASMFGIVKAKRPVTWDGFMGRLTRKLRRLSDAK